MSALDACGGSVLFLSHTGFHFLFWAGNLTADETFRKEQISPFASDDRRPDGVVTRSAC